MPSEADVRSGLREFLTQNFLLGRGSAQVTDGQSFLDSGLVDSTGILEFVNHLQDKWSIRVEDDELLPENFDSLDNLSRFVLAKLGK